jgi:hypothetical protein
MSNREMRKHALRRYVVFRVKLIEFLDIHASWQAFKSEEFVPITPVSRTAADFAAALRTVQLSWFSIFIDKSKDGMDVIKLWKELFPDRELVIEQAWAQMEPAWGTLRRFRNKAGFHADKPLAFFRARESILTEWNVIITALEAFKQLAMQFLKDEAKELPELESVVDDLLDDLEENQARHFSRDEFKKYLMIPNSDKGKVAENVTR